MVKHLKDLLAMAKEGRPERLVVIAAEDDDVLQAVLAAKKEGFIEPVLVGNETEIRKILKELSADPAEFSIVAANSLEEAAKKGLTLFAEGKADFIMKGLIDTSILMKNVLDRQYGLRQDGLLSHVMVYEFERYHKLIGLTDGGMNIAPSLEQKKLIADNAFKVFRALGYPEIKMAGIAAKEKANEKMPVTMEAKALKDLITDPDVIYEGPLALDLILDKEAAQIKHFESRIAGDVDIILVPTIEVGNALGKSVTYIGGGESAGIIMGAKVPVVLVSRADTAETKLYSIALGKMISQHGKGKNE